MQWNTPCSQDVYEINNTRRILNNIILLAKSSIDKWYLYFIHADKLLASRAIRIFTIRVKYAW